MLSMPHRGDSFLDSRLATAQGAHRTRRLHWFVLLGGHGLDDNCEYKLAHKFRPLMSFAVGDDVSREARWAVEWFDGDNATKTVRIAYMPGYWMDYGDGGTSETLCEIAGVVPIFWPFVTLETCGGTQATRSLFDWT